ncbi:hypothetical protein C2G38_2234634 [Gigaspora rosea]|uniref:Uncharacterized protein n=1 Tax=Gigaspora rosea TaxID=44941 RepID=A0A397TQ85_9GLOM|nr:hypothetical protein C2G38_2234634 [Gigaspora rosea]
MTKCINIDIDRYFDDISTFQHYLAVLAFIGIGIFIQLELVQNIPIKIWTGGSGSIKISQLDFHHVVQFYWTKLVMQYFDTEINKTDKLHIDYINLLFGLIRKYGIKICIFYPY